MGANQSDVVLSDKYFGFELDGQFSRFPTDIAPNVLPDPFEDADGRLTPVPSTGTDSGVFAAAADSWDDGNAFQFLTTVEAPHSILVDTFRFYDRSSPGGPTDWILRIDGVPVAGGPTHSSFTLNLESFSLPPLQGTTRFELVGTGATDPAAIWAVDDVLTGFAVPEPSGLALVGTAVAAFLLKRLLGRPKRLQSVYGRRGGVQIRGGSTRDVSFLESMLFEAIHWNERGVRPNFKQFRNTAQFRQWLDGWGKREGDTSAIAEIAGKSVGAAWYRYWTPEMRSCGFVDSATPEVCIGITRQHRSRGVGRMLIGSLIEKARSAGVPALSLSVDPNNYALNLYRSLGFRQVGTSEATLKLALKL